MKFKILQNKQGIVILIAVFLVFLGVLARFLPHPPNFVPLLALALFSACYLPKKWALIAPLGAMLLSDVFIGFYQWQIMLAVYFSFFLMSLLGFMLKKRQKWYLVAGFSALGSLLFFLITNFAVFAFSPWYPKTLAGLLQCYIMALPFLRNTFFSALFYSSCFFGVYQLIVSSIYANQGLAKINID